MGVNVDNKKTKNKFDFNKGFDLLNFICFRFIMRNNLTMGNYMTITLLFNYILSPIDNFISLLNEYHFVKNSIRRVNDLLDADKEIIADNKLELNGNIEVRNLSFTFNNKYYPLYIYS